MKKIVIEHGEIIQATGDRARVRLPRNDSCLACGLCLFGADKGGLILEAENAIGAAAGDTVEVEMPCCDPLAAAGLLFGAPLLALLAGAGVGYALAGDGAAVTLGMLFLAGSFFLVRRREKQQRRARGNIRIVRVVPPPPPPA